MHGWFYKASTKLVCRARELYKFVFEPLQSTKIWGTGAEVTPRRSATGSPGQSCNRLNTDLDGRAHNSAPYFRRPTCPNGCQELTVQIKSNEELQPTKTSAEIKSPRRPLPRALYHGGTSYNTITAYNCTLQLARRALGGMANSPSKIHIVVVLRSCNCILTKGICAELLLDREALNAIKLS